jgi:N utilization substance protein A
MRGIRIQNIVKELHDEKIDVIEWNPDAEQFISKALSPARVTGVYLDDDIRNGRTAIVVVPDDQLSLAIGREGQNARLAAKLTGWRIDIKSVTETVSGALENLDVPPLDGIVASHAKLIEEVRVIMAKKDANRAIMPEEFTTLGKFASLIEKRLQRLRDDMRREERAHIMAVKATLPEALFDVPIDVLDLGEDITEALQELPTVGDVMLATLTDETRLSRLLAGVAGDAVSKVQIALDEIMEGDFEAEDEALAPVAVAAPVVAPEAEAEEEEVLLDAFGGIIREEEPEVEEEVEEAPVVEGEVAPVYSDFDMDDDLFDGDDRDRRDKKKEKKKKRRLVYDEESGEVVAKKQRKRAGRKNDWQDDF